MISACGRESAKERERFLLRLWHLSPKAQQHLERRSILFNKKGVREHKERFSVNMHEAAESKQFDNNPALVLTENFIKQHTHTQI